MKTRFALVCCFILAVFAAAAQQKSPKRGICWDEKTQILSDAPIDRMLPGVSWIYNWGVAPRGTASKLGNEGGIAFVPMAWGRNFNEDALRSYVSSHPTTKYLLGFNEPNFSAQSAMTPSDAAKLWPRLEAIAEEYGLKLVSPALNFSGERVGGRVWGIYDWLDEFVRVYKKKNGRLPRIDCIALHCYMNWAGANTWFVNEYIYKNIFENGNDKKYHNLVELLNSVKEATGQFPRMMLTEFCSWEGDKDGFKTNVDNQIDQMTQRIQMMEQSELVEGYAWYMANTYASQYPYASAFEANNAKSELSMLGKVLVYMSGFDTGKYYIPGETIGAKDYVDATTDDQLVRLRPNTDEASALPLQIELTPAKFKDGAVAKSSAASYQIDVPAEGSYVVSLRAKGAGARLAIGDSAELIVAGHEGEWADYQVSVELPAGRSAITIANVSEQPVLLNSWKFDAASENTVDRSGKNE